MSRVLPVPHRLQLADGYCLPACAEMVLAYWGINRAQSDLARQLQIIARAGIPASRICWLASAEIKVTCRTGVLADLVTALDQGIPPIMLVNTGQLPYWGLATAHAVVLLGMEREQAALNDPGISQSPIHVSLGDLLLAWDEMANRYALISKK